MNDNHENEISSQEQVGYSSPNSEDIVLDGPGDRTVRPLRPELIPWALYEQDRMNNPTKPASMPRPETRPPRPTQAQ
jgi:hypothetical protein